MSSSTLTPTTNYRYTNGESDDSEEEDGQVMNYDSDEEHAMMQYDAANSYMYPYSKKDSLHYDKEWSEWRYGKPFHSKEWPSSMMFAEQLTSEELYRGARAAEHDEFWGKEDPWDYYVYYKGTPYENLDLVERTHEQKARAQGINVYETERMDNGMHESEADLGEGFVYTRSNDVLTDSGRDRYVRITEKITPTVYNQAPRSNRETSGRPVIEYMRGPVLPRDQVVRDDLPTGAPTTAPPVMPDMRYPGIRETKFGWKSDFGSPDGGYVGEGENLTTNDVTEGMINRQQIRIPIMMGGPSSQVSGVGDAIAINEPGGERRNADGDTRMSLWGSVPVAPNTTDGWFTRPDDISSGSRVRHGNAFMSQWGNLPGTGNATAGWRTRQDDITGEARMRHENPFMSLWGNLPDGGNATSGWYSRPDDITGEARVRHGVPFMALWGGGPSNPNPTAGWRTRPDDITSEGRMRANRQHEMYGANAAAPEPSGPAIGNNNPINGARISDRKSLVSDDFMAPTAPNGAFGGLNVNQRVPESRGRRPETMTVTGNRGFFGNMYDGFFSTGSMYGYLRPLYSRVGAIGGSMEGTYVQDMFNLTNNGNGRKYRSTEPQCSLMQQVMKGLGSKTICDMSDPASFEDLSPTLLW